MYSVRENVMYMLSFENFVHENWVCDENDGKNEQMSYNYTLFSKTSNTYTSPTISMKNSQNRDYIQAHCNDIRNPFTFASRHWYLYKNPQY